MPRGMNKVFLIGNLGGVPDLRRTKKHNKAICKFSLATNEEYKSSASGEWKEHTEWHNVLVWGKAAESCAKHLGKGSLVHVEGRIRTREQRDREGHTYQLREVHAVEVKFLGSSPGGDAPPPGDNDEVPF
jgi:single-strand DNA-binding protein